MNPSKENNCHDTVGILVLDSNMQIAAGNNKIKLYNQS